MLVLRSCPTLLPRLLLAPHRLLSTIGRKPRAHTWLTAGLTAAADGSKEPAVGCIHSSSGRGGSSSGSNKGSRGSSTISAAASGASASAADLAPHLQPQPAGAFKVTAKDLAGQGKVRLDAYLASQLPDASRAKISASIKAGLIVINKAIVAKPSYTVKAGDAILAALLPPEPCTAIPEDIPLNIVYEDDHLIVVNKAPGMVVHLSPGHTTGTLVNALLGHCGLPACDAIPSGSSSSSGGGSGGGLFGGQAGGVLGGILQEDDLDEAEEDEEPPSSNDVITQFKKLTDGTATGPANSSSNSTTGGSIGGKGIIRPGIVHRLDRGTSGLMVVAKTHVVHAGLCQQFKERSVSRIYNSITVGWPGPQAARVATNIVRDPGNRLRMMAVPYGSGRGRTAASNYQTLEAVAGGGAAVVQWKLETGRTHQIRVHAKHIGHPLLGDDMYGPNHAASSRQVVGKRSSLAAAAKAAVEGFGRPALHAKTLGFTHPVTKQRMEFDSEWPTDFRQLYNSLQEWS